MKIIIIYSNYQLPLSKVFFPNILSNLYICMCIFFGLEKADEDEVMYLLLFGGGGLNDFFA